jgi:L-lactate dehydrogenase complex protein LldF
MINTQLLGVKAAGDLPFASSLCGACNDICPVKIPITEILLQLRHRVVEGDVYEGAAASRVLRAGAQAGGLTFSLPALYEFGSQALKVAQAPLRRGEWLPHLPPPANRWTMARPFPVFNAWFRDWWRDRTPQGRRRNLERKLGLAAFVVAAIALVAWLFRRKGNL